MIFLIGNSITIRDNMKNALISNLSVRIERNKFSKQGIIKQIAIFRWNDCCSLA